MDVAWRPDLKQAVRLGVFPDGPAMQSVGAAGQQCSTIRARVMNWTDFVSPIGKTFNSRPVSSSQIPTPSDMPTASKPSGLMSALKWSL